MKRPRYLTNRQLEVLRLAANGNENAKIARMLGISTATVTEILSRAYTALGVHSRTQAVVAALHLRLFTLEDLQPPAGFTTEKAQESVEIAEEKEMESPAKTPEFSPREVRLAFRMADIMLHLDRCEHGRHENDPCGSCGDRSRGNPHIRTGQILGYDLRGNRISMPSPEEKSNPAAWRG